MWLHFVKVYWVSISWVLVAASGMTITPDQVTIRNDEAQSTISYVLKHPFHTVTGISRQVNSNLTIEQTTATITAVKVIAPIRSFDSGNKTRDKDMLKVTDVATHPDVSFTSTQITGSNENLNVKGRLVFHGVTKEISFKAEKQQKGANLIVDGQFVISLEAYNIKRPSIFGMKVKDNLTVYFHMVYPTAKTGT